MKLLLSIAILLLLVPSATPHINDSVSPYHDILHHLYGPFTTATSLDLDAVEEIHHEVLEAAHCGHGHGDSATNCTECLEKATNAAGNIDSTSAWNTMSMRLLYATINLDSFCNMTSDEMQSFDYESAITSMISSGGNSLGDEELESLLAVLSSALAEDDDHNDHDHEAEDHEDHDDHGHNDENHSDHSHNDHGHDNDENHEDHGHDNDENHDDHGHDDHGHDNNENHNDHGHDNDENHDNHGQESATQKCFGEDVLLHYMALDHGESTTMTRLPELVGYTISFLAQGWTLTDNCEVKPRQTDILDSVFNQLGNGGNISEEGFETMLTALGIGSVSIASSGEEEGHDNHSDHEGHDHKRKRSINSIRYRRSAGDEDGVTAQCLSEGDLASIYGLDLSSGVTKEQFIALCPALIQQQIGNHCISAAEVNRTEANSKNLAAAYGYSVLSVVIITLLSLLGIVALPLMNKPFVNYLLEMFVALGVSTLFSDALLHLLPMALGLHSHAEEGESPVTETTQIQVVVALAVYIFFVFESIMQRLKPQNSQNHGHSHNMVLPEKNAQDDDSQADDVSPEPRSDDSGTMNSCKKIPTVAMLILVGDGIHNFMDGLVIGAAFAYSPSEGLGTSIAIFCHELPHELGDFSILVRSGMSMCKAALLNLLSGCTSIIGVFIGVALGSNEEIRKWLVAATGGMFIYISLVAMMPALMAPKPQGKWWIYFLLQNIGFLLGLAIMLVISVYEGKLVHM